MASFSERFHEYTKYNPDTIARSGKIGTVQEPLFRPGKDPEAIELHPYLSYLANQAPSSLQSWLASPQTALLDPSGFVAALCYFSVGITHIMRSESEHYYFRANPSAGGLYPTEMYLALRNHPVFADGLYYFHPLQLSLWPVMSFDPWPLLQSTFFDQDTVSEANVLLLYTARANKSVWRYQDRAYRRMLLDTGHALGNSTAFLEYHHHPYQILNGYKDSVLCQRLGLEMLDEPVLSALALRHDGEILAPSLIYRSPSPKEALSSTSLSQAFYQNQIAVEQCISAHAVQNPKPALDFKTELSWEYPALQPHIPINIRLRRSCRQFAPKAMDLDPLAQCLQYAFASHHQLPGADSIEHYLVLRSVHGMEPGVYRYHPLNHSLIKLQELHHWEAYHNACLQQEVSADCAALWFMASDLAPLMEELGDRAYRYQTLQCGLWGERLHLAGIECGLGISGLGGYFDDLINDLLGLEHTKAILYGCSLGLEYENLQ